MLKYLVLKLIVFTALLTLNHWAIGKNTIGADTALAEQLNRLAQEELNRSGTPSLQIAIARHGEVVYEGAFGFANLENEVLAKRDSRYRTASIAKWFTATAAMRLYANQQLDLDAPIQNYCPTFPKKSEPITTRQLMAHTAGIRGYIDYQQRIDASQTEEENRRWRERHTRAQLNMKTPVANVDSSLDSFKHDPLEFVPGAGWGYTSFGYRLLSCVLEGAAEQTFSELMTELVFTPAAMTLTEPDDARKLIADRVSGYEIRRDVPIQRARYRDVSENLAAGGYLSTATDLVKFAYAYQTTLLSIELRAEMTRPTLFPTTNISNKKSWRDAIPTEGRYGAGIMLFDHYEPGMIGHTGRQDGGSAVLVLVPDKTLAIAVMTNAKGWNGYLTFIRQILDVVESHPPGLNHE